MMVWAISQDTQLFAIPRQVELTLGMHHVQPPDETGTEQPQLCLGASEHQFEVVIAPSAPSMSLIATRPVHKLWSRRSDEPFDYSNRGQNFLFLMVQFR
jgi:hypothetical protein